MFTILGAVLNNRRGNKCKPSRGCERRLPRHYRHSPIENFEPSEGLASLLGRSALLESNEEIVDRNANWFHAFYEVSQTMEPDSDHYLYENNEFVCRQGVFSTDLFVDFRNGNILEIGFGESIDPSLVYGEHTARLTLQVLVDHNTSDYQRYSFALNGPEDIGTGELIPLEEVLSVRAINNLEKTLDICNPPSA